MQKIYRVVPLLFIVSSVLGCNPTTSKEEVISLYLDSSRLYIDSLDEKGSCPLKTYHHKYFGEIPYVSLDEYCDSFPTTSIKSKKDYVIEDGKFIVSSNPFGSFMFDAEKDLVTTSKDVMYFFNEKKCVNYMLPYDIYRANDFERFTKGSPLSHYLSYGKERTYDCKKYNFDIVYEKGKYYAPFSLLNSLFFEFGNETVIYNGKDYFDVDALTGENPLVQYCYSSKGNFLLDLSGGKLGTALFENKTPVGDEEYHFETEIKASGQKIIFSLKNGGGFIDSYDKDGKLIEEDVYKKVKYEKANNLLYLRYFSVMDKEDDESKAISDIYKLTIHMDETWFLKKNRSQEVADFTYQELRFAMYELYGTTINTEVKDFDTFIKDKEYKEDLLSLDASKYDEAMSKFLLQGIDDCHTSIGVTSIYNLPTYANSNHHTTSFSGKRYDATTSLASELRDERKKAKLDVGVDIVDKTAFIAFDKFRFARNNNKVIDLKGYKEYQNTNPSDYVEDNTMAFFASAFNMIEKDQNVKNVVIDLSCNTGGLTATLAYLISYLTDDPCITCGRLLNDSVVQYHYKTDLDQDGIYGSNTDTFKGKYKFFVLTSGASFSCGNHFPSICKDSGIATIIGERSAGGSCSISQISNSSGFIYCSSSENVSLMKQGDEYIHNDYGVTPDISIPRSDWYNHIKLNELLNKLN